MKNFSTHYTVVGSSALQSKSETTIIEFPGLESFQESLEAPDKGLFSKMKESISSLSFIQELKQGSIKGKPINKSKPWQNIAVGSFFFIFAFACIWFGR